MIMILGITRGYCEHANSDSGGLSGAQDTAFVTELQAMPKLLVLKTAKL